MGAVRVVVDDVDEAIEAFEATGYAVAQRWGPPFAILSGPGPDLWLSGSETSAARASAELPSELRAAAAVRLVVEVADVDVVAEELAAEGWEVMTGPVSGPGGLQRLLRRGAVVLEVFASD
jgi:hypothetical protein